MRAAIYHGQRNVTIEDQPTPACGPRDVRLQTIYASVCGTDAAVYKHGPGTGHRVTVGGEFGHEAVCRVAQTGPKGLGFPVCDHGGEDVRQRAINLFGTAHGLGGPTANADIYLDAAGSEGLLELFQDMGKIGSGMVVVAGHPDQALNIVIRF